ncbi:MAG TPA: TonB-dependent receptor, partial [bacterium]|nr:TonB-dependent receptor [bacterium]
GARYTHDSVTNAPGLAFDPSTLDQGLFSAFLQDELALGADLVLTAGSKLEHNDYTGFEWEPSARLKWDLAPGQMLWTAVSRAVRAPSRVDRDILLPTPNFSPIVDDLLVGGKDFQSETLVAYELGYRAELAKGLSTSASAFFNNYDDIRSTSLSPPNAFLLPFPLYYANNLAAQTWGLELTTDWQAAPGWRLHLGYDLLQEKVWVKHGQFDFNNALNETADPRNQFFLRSPLDLPAGFELDPAFRFVDSLTYNASGAAAVVPSYAELDLRLGWRATSQLELSVTGQNLLHDHHLEYVISSPNPQENVVRRVYGEIQCRL